MATAAGAAEYFATGVSPTVDVTADDATLKLCIVPVTSGVATTFDTGAESFDTASDVTVEFKGRCVVVGTVVSDRDLPPDRMMGVAVAGGALVDPFNVVSSGVDGVRVLVGVVALIWAPPVLRATPAGPDGVVEPVDVEVMVDVDAEEAADVFEGVEEAAELDVPVFGLADDDEPDGAAHAVPWLVNRAVPTPSATASPPIRPAYASLRTRQLYR
jgi:hypothetical protein